MSIISKFNSPSFLDALCSDYFLFEEEAISTKVGPFQPTLQELKWLQHMLETEMADAFLSEETKRKLVELLKDVPSVAMDDWIQLKQMPQLEKVAAPFLKELKSFIRNKQGCIFTYSTKAGYTYKEEGFPIQLMYNIAKKRWYIQWVNEHLLRKTTPLDYLREVSESNADLSKYMEFLEQMHIETKKVVIQWTPKLQNMDVHRFLHAFSAFRIQVVVDEPLTMEIHYMEDEESFLLSKIRQFGPHVWIKSPDYLQKAMIDSAKRALENYK